MNIESNSITPQSSPTAAAAAATALARQRSSSINPSSSTPVPSLKQLKDLRTDSSANFDLLLGKPSALDEERIQRYIEDKLIATEGITQNNTETTENQLKTNINTTDTTIINDNTTINTDTDTSTNNTTSSEPVPAAVPAAAPTVDTINPFNLSDILPFIQHGLDMIIANDFSRCFESIPSDNWNWNSYLYIIWLLGLICRYTLLFPFRFICLILGFILFTIKLLFIKLLLSNDPIARRKWERGNIRFLCSVFVFSWFGVIKYHGTIPTNKPNRIYVANHTSMIDMIILSQMNTFSVVGQKHPGWIGFCQDSIIGCLNNCWFNRSESSDRTAVSRKIKEHISNPDSNRLLIFPEGTCVNNQYVVQFKRGTFDMGAEICPIAIKYNKIFVDAYWNSRKESFASHLITLMCSWAVVCDVYYLEPQRQLPTETGIEFSNRIKSMIAHRARLVNTNFDGYLKHFVPSARYIQQQQATMAKSILQRLANNNITPEQFIAAVNREKGKNSNNTNISTNSNPDSILSPTTLSNRSASIAAKKMASMVSASSRMNLSSLIEDKDIDDSNTIQQKKSK